MSLTHVSRCVVTMARGICFSVIKLQLDVEIDLIIGASSRKDYLELVSDMYFIYLDLI